MVAKAANYVATSVHRGLEDMVTVCHGCDAGLGPQPRQKFRTK